MTEDQAPPTPLPPASEAPYPERPAPHPQRDEALDHLPESGPAIGALGITLASGAVAAALGLLVAIPLLRRRKPKAKPAPRARRPRRKRAND
jgi:hypothetical protein